MKTKSTVLITAIVLLFSSCIKDYDKQDEGGENIEFTSENYLYEGALEKQFLEEKIASIDLEIDELELTTPNDPSFEEDQKKIEELQQDRESSKQRIGNIIDLGQVGLDIPIPCDQPNGKCVPKRLEYLIVSKEFSQAAVLVKNENGKTIGFSERLIDLPDYEKDLQYLRIPVVTDFEQQISIEIFKKDNFGERTEFTIFLNR